LGYAVFKWKPKEETVASAEKPKERRRTDSEVARDTRATAIFILSGLILNYAPWLALSILIRRIGFNYYMIYTLPFVALGVAFTWKLLPKRLGKSVLALNVLLALAFFLYYFPVHPMP
jgi:dolichyl-phosphate-mannose--protein O-mannosyl transferase